MQLRYHELVGKEVVTVDDQRVGRLVDLVAEERGNTLRVTALLIGPLTFLARFGLGWASLRRRAAHRTLPFAWVAHVDDRIHLRVGLGEIRATEDATPMHPDGPRHG